MNDYGTQGGSAGSAIVFPGMGPSKFEDVAKFVVINQHARRLFAIADEVLGYSLVDRYRESDGDYSEAAQVAFFVNCLALASWAEEIYGVDPLVCAGPSFGGKAAAVYSGALSFADGVALTARLARCLEEYFAVEFRDAVTHSFARTPEDRLLEILDEMAADGEWYDISCRVDHDFHMITLRAGKLEWLQRRLRGAGGLPLYTMVPPMHASAFGALREKAEAEVVGEFRFSDPRLPVVADQDGTMLTSAAGVRAMLLDGFDRATLWPDVVATLRRLGVAKLYMSGSDSLFGRVRVTTDNFEVVAVDPRTVIRPRRRVRADRG